jgi:chemotaxis protein histidine kinase CheA
MADPTDKAREEFFSEAQEIIENLSRNLLALDAGIKEGISDPALVNEAFRAVHTLKGLGGCSVPSAWGPCPIAWRTCWTRSGWGAST